MLLGVGDDPRFATFADRVTNRSALDSLLANYCASQTSDEVVQAFTEAEAAAGHVLDMADIANDPHFIERNLITELDGTPMQGLIANLSRTPGKLRWQGRKIDADGDHIRAHGWD
jgi:crotonobetainyl-CoA:carnitine CoA-transferase CaiB-like acyl-CoA transferase